jgi:hypothetical protein
MGLFTKDWGCWGGVGGERFEENSQNTFFSIIFFAKSVYFALRVRIRIDFGRIQEATGIEKSETFKGTVSRDFSLLVFFINQFPPSPRVSH